MRAKDILSEYPIHPEPFIIELDQRGELQGGVVALLTRPTSLRTST